MSTTHHLTVNALTIPSRPSVHFGMRITPAQQSELHRLAEELDCAPSSLARLALGRGLEQIERERRRA